MKLLKIIHSKIIYVCLIIFCALCLIITTLIIGSYVISVSPANTTVYAKAENEIDFSVYYIENEVFGSGAMPSGLNYLMSFTDYIEIKNSFSAQLSQEAEIICKYTASETLVIRQKVSDGNNNPVVCENKISLANINKTATGKSLSFKDADSAAEAGGVHVVDLKKHIGIYNKFVREQKEQYTIAHKEDVATEKALAFSAELLVDFTYNIQVTEIGLNETLSRGYLIPLSNEVYDLEVTGTPGFDVAVTVNEFEMPGFWGTLLLFLWFSGNVLGICYGIKQLTQEKNECRREVKRIFKKYMSEIIVSAHSVDISEYKMIAVPRFQELLKLAVNLGKHILCFYDEQKAEFCVIVDGYAYCWNVSNEDNTLSNTE
ncbi:MAG: DUF5305 domain-containing protein [Firmicutes bacterium]|nr:DUF5305 domain-containing protein [Bacillota bacterium]